MVKFIQAENAPSQFVITKKRREVCTHRCDQTIVNRDRNIIAKERGLERGRKIARARTEDIRFDRVCERRGEGVLVVFELFVELVEGALTQCVIALNKKRTERALCERMFAALLVEQSAEFHIDVGQLRERVVVAIECDVAESEQPFFCFGKNVRLHAANLFQLRSPRSQNGIV